MDKVEKQAKMPCSELMQNFKYFINMKCYFVEDAMTISLSCAMTCVLFIVAALFMYRKAKQVRSQITEPDTLDYIKPNTTYCYFSVKIIDFTKYMLLLTILLLLYALL